tara:strand:- start:92 stop:424 length:333 start_codon:yes stop_codon:yes gene_type:complete
MNDSPDMPTPAEQFLAMRIAELLQRKYAGHLWGVHVKKSVATIHNMALSGNHGYILHLNNLKIEDEFNQRVIKAGGEILERFAVSRGEIVDHEMASLKRDFANRPVFDGR